MICYKDMTFCPFYTRCKEGLGCARAFTPTIKHRAETFGKEQGFKDGFPVSQFIDPPKCLKPIETR